MATILLISYLIMPTLGIMGSRNISSNGIISYSVNQTIRPIHTEGQMIKDDVGNVIKLYGGHLHHETGLLATESLIRRIKDYGLNAFKIHVWWSKIMPTKGVIDESYFSSDPRNIDALVRITKELGLYIVLQMQIRPAYSNPTWLRYGVSDKQWRTDFWRGNSPQENSQNHIIYIFKYMASRYANEPHVIFSWFNDNYGGYQTPSEFGQNYKIFSERAIDAIREVENFKHLILLETPWNEPGGGGAIIEEMPNIDRDNIAWSTRGYPSDPAVFYTSWFQKVHDHYKIGFDKPFVFSEFGVEYRPPEKIPPSNWQSWFDNIFNWFETHDWNWFIWQMHNDPETPGGLWWTLFYKNGTEKPTMNYAKQYFPTS